MNKNDLITAAAQHAGISKKDTELVVNAALEAVSAALAAGEKVQISGFGVFEIKQREARVGRNPHTGEPIPIPASRAPVFRPSKTLKDLFTK